ncbi:MAG: AAA family ATPase [Helicobacteraceae bacterium]|jgi:DNA repair protein RecN (Recombination protein N)|nr:AAA family ATPase [Helicobacteraceae bacterium]
MIKRVSIKEALTFKSVVLEPHKGLNVFSGPSGAGKSILMNAILALFGLSESEAAQAEVAIVGVKPPIDAPIAIDGDEIIARLVKKDKTRYFVNDAQIGKTALKATFEGIARRLNQKDTADISSNNLLSLLDLLADNRALTDEFAQRYDRLKTQKAQLEALKNKEASAQDLREFARFELDKIVSIAPKEGEYERLLELKKRLSKKEKIAEILEKTLNFKEKESEVYALYDALGLSRAVFEEAMFDLDATIAKAQSALEEIETLDPETMLDRIERLSGLIRRFGGINEALAYAQEKKAEIASFESLEADIKRLTNEVKELEASAIASANKICEGRIKAAKPLEAKINGFLARLRMNLAAIALTKTELNEQAGQKAAIALNGANVEKISGGEFNRLRLALLCAREELQEEGDRAALFLDEIDANVSGEEAASIAKVLKFLSTRYQIFAISHHSQLTSKADAHYLVSKENGESRVCLLDRKGRIDEIARIISADQITDSALKHAEALLDE